VKPSLPPTVAPRYLSVAAAVIYLGIPKSTLAKSRLSGDGPRYSKRGRHVLYDIRDLDAWIAAGMRQSTSESAKPDLI